MLKQHIKFGIVLVAFFVSFSHSGYAQSKKDLKKFKIKSTTEVVTDFQNGKETSHTERIEKYDSDGNLIEESEFNKDGSFKKKETRKFNKAGEVVEEIKFNAAGAIITKEVTSYNENNDKVNEQTVDGSGKILEWNKYGYDSLGEKI
ncbi:MAG TPA: hypothetical protein PKD91_11220, partial [Bacteroidia bacterium]|nr:hypothetical protein [Bacteroidia bacterium]